MPRRDDSIAHRTPDPPSCTPHQVEAHPKIKSNPFLGTYEVHLFVKPPAPSPVAQHGPPAVAFQFVVRRGCTVTVKAAPDDTVELVITIDSENYAPPALPARTERTWSREELGKLDPNAADGYLKAEEWGFVLHAALGTPLGGIEGAALATAILARGIVTDEYDVTGMVSANPLDTSRSLSALTSSIPDLPGQLAVLEQQRDALASEVQGDEGDLAELKSEKEHVNPAIIKKAQQKLDADRRALAQLEQQIAALQATPPRGVIEDDSQPFPVLDGSNSATSPQTRHNRDRPRPDGPCSRQRTGAAAMSATTSTDATAGGSADSASHRDRLRQRRRRRGLGLVDYYRALRRETIKLLGSSRRR
jgi:hypothetical protein